MMATIQCKTDPLSRRPVFGDVEQIKALKALRALEESREG